MLVVDWADGLMGLRVDAKGSRWLGLAAVRHSIQGIVACKVQALYAAIAHAGLGSWMANLPGDGLVEIVLHHLD